jgi:hypothetical protein
MFIETLTWYQKVITNDVGTTTKMNFNLVSPCKRSRTFSNIFSYLGCERNENYIRKILKEIWDDITSLDFCQCPVSFDNGNEEDGICVVKAMKKPREMSSRGLRVTD